MGFSCGIVGLPNVGKSTLFNALVKAIQAAAANYPFCTIEPNVGRVPVPDDRLDTLHRLAQSQRKLPAFMEFVDIAGLVRGASQGEGLGNQFLDHIRKVNAIAQVVRCFDDSDIVHVEGHADPLRDIGIIQTELGYSDLSTVEKSLEKMVKGVRIGDKKVIAYHACATRLREHLACGQVARRFETINDDEIEYLATLHLLTAKPTLYVCNISESDLAKAHDLKAVKAVKEWAAQHGEQAIVLCAKIEEELGQCDDTDALEYRTHLGLERSGLEDLIVAGYKLLGLSTYFTVGEQEARAWTIPQNCKAPQAAGVIHSDFEKGFICAEVYAYEDFARLGSELKVKEAGLSRKEGKEYTCRDGDVMHFLFNR